jgi:hypothetical protein
LIIATSRAAPVVARSGPDRSGAAQNRTAATTSTSYRREVELDHMQRDKHKDLGQAAGGVNRTAACAVTNQYNSDLDWVRNTAVPNSYHSPLKQEKQLFWNLRLLKEQQMCQAKNIAADRSVLSRVLSSAISSPLVRCKSEPCEADAFVKHIKLGNHLSLNPAITTSRVSNSNSRTFSTQRFTGRSRRAGRKIQEHRVFNYKHQSGAPYACP